jgi:pyridoxal phosphate-dependent aminotransferase EpsN
LTFVASANPVLYQGATPVFIDSEFDTWNMCPQVLAKAFETYAAKHQLPKAVIVVNLYGQSAKYDEIVAICEQYQVPIIEDAAESLGATYQGQASGSFGRLGIYSFNGNKIITTSGGGMLVADDPELIRQAKFLATQAKDSAPYYQHSIMGYNYRMSNILAGVGRGQLKVLDDRVAARREIFQRYQQACVAVPAIKWMPEYGANSRATRWLSVLRLDPQQTEISVEMVISRLAERQIEARRVWKPLHLQPMFNSNDYFSLDSKVSCAEQLFQQGICLPSGSSLSISKQDYVIDALLSVFE